MSSALPTQLLRTVLACWLVVVSGSDTLALAQPSAVTPLAAGAREGARVAGRLGVDAYNRGDYVSAVHHFRRAIALFEYPTLWLFLARSLEHTGRVVEAKRAYASLLASPVDPSEGAIEADARSEARRKLIKQAAQQASSPVLPTSAAAESDSRGWSLPLTVSVLASAAFAIGAVATGVLSVEHQSQFDALNRPETSLEDRNAAHARALRMQLLNAVCVGGAVLGGSATLFFLFQDGPDTPTTNTPRESRSTSASSALYVGLAGRF